MRNFDLSCLAYKSIISDFIKSQALFLPTDESTRNYLNLHVEFMCFVASTSLSIDISEITIPKLSQEGLLTEYPLKIFGSSQKPDHTNDPLSQSLAHDLFNTFVLPNLVHLCELHPLDHGIDNYQDMLLKHTAVIQSFKLLFALDPNNYRILLHSFLLPVIDDCLSNLDKISAHHGQELIRASEYFITKQIDFLYEADQLELIRPIVKMMISKLESNWIELQSSQVSVIVDCLSIVYPKLAFDLDYKVKELILDIVIRLSNGAVCYLNRELISNSKNREGNIDQFNVVVPIQLFKACVSLSKQISTKTFIFLTSEVKCNYLAIELSRKVSKRCV